MSTIQKDEEVTFTSFGKPFQEKLAQLIVDEPGFADQVGEVIDTDFFELKYLQIFTKLVYDYKSKYKKYPSKSTLESLLKTDLSSYNEAAQKQVRDFYVRIASNSIQSVDPEYVKEKSIDFCKKQTLKGAIIESIDLMEKSSFDEVSKIINHALKLGTNNEQGYDYLRHFEKRFEYTFRNPVSTGWKIVDGYIGGGHGKGELGVCIAPTGAGKSFVLTHLGASALKEGKNVVHYTLELQDVVVARRYDACLTGYPLDSLFDMKEDIFEHLQDLEGQLIVKEYPAKRATTETIRNHLERLMQRGHDIDMVIIDYADLLKPVKGAREKTHELETIYEELRGMAAEFGVPFWTASQTNRSGLNEEVITMKSISEAFSKCFVADFIFSLSRTATDKMTNTGRIYIAKNRNGPDGIVCPVFMDTSRAKIEVNEPTGETIEEIKKVEAKKQGERLSEKYDKWKKKAKKKKGGEKDGK